MAARSTGDGGAGRLQFAELRVNSGLKLPDSCVLDVALRSAASRATFEESLAAGARQRGVHLLP